jgi:hypothetical protein
MQPPGEWDVSEWTFLNEEPMGEPGKRWLVEPGSEDENGVGVRWLFKPVRVQNDRRGPFLQGDDWAEKVAAELAKLIGLPTARVELARYQGGQGALSRDVTRRGKLTAGNELMWAYDQSYPAEAKPGQVTEYTLERIFESLAAAEVTAPHGFELPGQTAESVFAGYLLFDGWIANQDRHHGNWGIIEDLEGGAAPTLAPSFDHASSLGFQLHEQNKLRILGERSLERWAAKGVCRPMAGRPKLVDLAVTAVTFAGAPGHLWRERLEAVTSDHLLSTLEKVPDARMSEPSRTFAVQLLETNRRRLLDAI